MSAIESWFAPAAIAEPLPKPRKRATAAAAKTKPKAQRKRQPSLRVRLPLVWMSVFALLLVGVVALNVAVLRANVSVTNLDKTIAQRQQAISTLKAEYARDTAPPRIAADARAAGMSQASTASTTTLVMGSH